MKRVRSSSEGIVRIVVLGMLASANSVAITQWNLVAAPMLRGFQQDLQYQQQQMANYADAMSPSSIEYHTAQANAAQSLRYTCHRTAHHQILKPRRHRTHIFLQQS